MYSYSRGVLHKLGSSLLCNTNDEFYLERYVHNKYKVGPTT